MAEMRKKTGRSSGQTPRTASVTSSANLVRFSKAAGHLDHVAAVIAELVPAINPGKLLTAVRLVADVPNAQRMGHILDLIRARRLTPPIHNWVKRQEPRWVPLRSGRSIAGAKEDQRWQVLVNEPLEVER